MIEAARALAAMAVVLFHADTLALRYLPQASGIQLFSVGERGVDFFFVLSGFIITFVHAKDIGDGRKVWHFAKKRFARIYPLLWLVVAGTVGLNIVIDGEVYGFAKLWTSFTLWPSTVWPSPAVAWTLRHEMLFYALFGVAILSRRFGLAAIAIWLAATVFQTAMLLTGGSFSGVAAMLFSPLNFQFAAGCLAGLAYLRWGDKLWQSALATGLALSLAVLTAMVLAELPGRRVLQYGDGSGVMLDLAFASTFGLMVYGLAGSSLHLRTPRFLLLAGAASYAIYLVHSSIMGVAARFLPFILPPDGLMLGAAHFLLFCIAVAAGIMLHLLFEKPVGRWLTGLLFAGRSPSAAPEHSHTEKS